MAMILDAFVGIFVEKVKDLVTKKAVTMLGVEDDLNQLQSNLLEIKKFLQAAERRRLEEPIIDHMLVKLKDVAYDADELIDECRMQGGSLLTELTPSSSSSSSPSSSWSWRRLVSENFTLSSRISRFLHRRQIGKRFRDLNYKLVEIHHDIVKFKLEESSILSEQMVTTVNVRQTSSLTEFDVVGDEIEEATNKLVKLMIQKQENRCCVFAITGMGGIGKTTLAQKVFNDRRLQVEFQVKIWVCISQMYSEIEVLQQVIRKGGGHHGEVRTKSELELLLQSTLSGKSVLLVLDDVWRADLWLNLLHYPLQFAGADIRVLVTTRDENVAIQIGVMDIHRVKPLSDETSWALLCRKVFGEGKQQEIRDVADVGFEIVTRCRGLPLAINAIAGVIVKEGSNRDEWEKVLNNKAWFTSNLPEEFRGALYLSYDDLSSPLKQCFLYCSLFPEDERLERSDLIRLWVAEGFAKEEGYCFMEDTAEGYYNELLRRNLLQPAPGENYANRICVMHDVMRSLAKFLSKDETLTPYIPTSSTKLRRLAVDMRERFSNLAGLLAEQKCLRTLHVFYGSSQLTPVLTGLTSLRVLAIRDTDFNKNITSIGVLLNLRYLSLFNTDIDELPESIGSLTNLQFLSFNRCSNLRKVPNSIMQLHNLRCLNLTNLQFLSFIPKGIEKLVKLNELGGFIVADPKEQLEDTYSSLKDVGSLHQLKTLSIGHMERAQKEDVSSLANLTHLIDLKLGYDNTFFSTLDYTGVEEALDELCPPSCLKQLCIYRYCGRRYPKWMQSPSFGASFPSLTSLSLFYTSHVTQLPPAGELPQLKSLSITRVRSVSHIGPEFLGIGSFPKLEFLKFWKMSSLEEWTFSETGETQQALCNPVMLLPRLVKVELSSCCKLKALPKRLEQSAIKELDICYADSLHAVSNLPNLMKLSLTCDDSLETVSDLPELQALHVAGCKALNLVEKVDALRRLSFLGYGMELPQWLVNLLQERKPTERDDFQLKMHFLKKEALERCLKGGPDWSILESIPSFIASSGKEFIRYTRTPFSYETNFVPDS